MQHAIDRALERYGLKLTPSDLKAIEGMAAPHNTVKRNDNGSSEHAISYSGQCVIVAMREGRIITFLPHNTFDATRRKNTYRENIGKAGKAGGFLRDFKLRQRRARRRESLA